MKNNKYRKIMTTITLVGLCYIICCVVPSKVEAESNIELDNTPKIITPSLNVNEELTYNSKHNLCLNNKEQGVSFIFEKASASGSYYIKSSTSELYLSPVTKEKLSKVTTWGLKKTEWLVENTGFINGLTACLATFSIRLKSNPGLALDLPYSNTRPDYTNEFTLNNYHGGTNQQFYIGSQVEIVCSTNNNIALAWTNGCTHPAVPTKGSNYSLFARQNYKDMPEYFIFFLADDSGNVKISPRFTPQDKPSTWLKSYSGRPDLETTFDLTQATNWYVYGNGKGISSQYLNNICLTDTTSVSESNQAFTWPIRYAQNDKFDIVPIK